MTGNKQKIRRSDPARANHLAKYRFKPGVSGNPEGRPKKKPITQRYEYLLEELAPAEVLAAYGLKKGATYGDVIAINMVNQAIQGEVPATKEITDRVEGKSYIVVQNNTLIANFDDGERNRIQDTMKKIREIAEESE